MKSMCREMKCNDEQQAAYGSSCNWQQNFNSGVRSLYAPLQNIEVAREPTPERAKTRPKILVGLIARNSVVPADAKKFGRKHDPNDSNEYYGDEYEARVTVPNEEAPRHRHP
jgi:hypothetical protein